MAPPCHCERIGLKKGQTALLGLRLRPAVPYNCWRAAEKGDGCQMYPRNKSNVALPS